MAEDKPKLRRDIEIIPRHVRGRQVLLVRDPLGLLSEPVVLSGDMLDMIMLLNGERTVRDIQFELMRRRGGVLIMSDEIEKVVQRLDSSYLLESQRYREARDRLAEEFAAQPVRKPSLAGSAYPEAADALRNWLDTILSASPAEVSPDPKGVVGMVAPHIELRAGQATYAAAYTCIRGGEFNRVIILGTGHGMDEGLFSFTTKDFETPFGLAKTDKIAVEKLKATCAPHATKNDMPHRSEHSIEFQLIFLQHILKSQDFLIIPILCGSMDGLLSQHEKLCDVPNSAEFFAGLRQMAAEDRTLCVAGVDLSHIGPKFGDDSSAYALEDETKKHDKALLDALCKRDAAAFWAEAKRVSDCYHVCGFSALASMIEILPDSEGQILNYEIWHEEATRSAVSFAAAAFRKTG